MVTDPRPLPAFQPPERQIVCDSCPSLLYGDKIPEKGTVLAGALLYDDGRLVGECVLHEFVVDAVERPGQVVNYEVVHWRPVREGETA